MIGNASVDCLDYIAGGDGVPVVILAKAFNAEVEN